MQSPSYHPSPSAASRESWASNGNSNEPSQTHHHCILPIIVPTSVLVESIAGAAHYSGSNVEQLLNHRNSSHDQPSSHTELKADHKRVLADIRSLYELKPTPLIFQRSWHPDAMFEVHV
jgi:hypothetical protein